MSMIIGITGGIGAGKSAVTSCLRRLGETVICADEVSRVVTQPGQPGHDALIRAFGSEFFFSDGRLNRKKMAEVVFSDDNKLRRLNTLLHPIIIARMFETAYSHGGRVFMDAALLIQSGMHERVDYVWVVVAPLETRIARVTRRDGLSSGQVRERISVQMHDDAMIPFADEIIRNDGTIKALCRKVEELLAKPPYNSEVTDDEIE